MKNEEIIKRYCVQIRRPFCIQDVADNTNIEKSVVFGVIHKFQDEGLIERICDTERPKLYRWKLAEPAKIQNKPSCETIERVRLYIESGKTHAEIAKELGISRSSVSMVFKHFKDTGVIDVQPTSEESILICRKENLRRLVKQLKIDYNKDIKSMTLDEIKKETERVRRENRELLTRSAV